MNGFRKCLEFVLGGAFSPLSEPVAGGSHMFWQQRLAERHLGLVSVAEPGSFEWAGNWIGLPSVTPMAQGGLRADIVGEVTIRVGDAVSARP